MRQRGRIWLSVAVAVGWVGGCECNESEPIARVGDAAPSGFGINDIVLVEAAGAVETRRAGEWGAAHVGEKLASDDAVRASAGGAATVAIGGAAEVALSPSSEVSFTGVADGRAKVKVERGRMHADLSGDDLVLEVASAGSSAVAEARRGSFTVFSDGHGLVAVASRAGEVTLKSSGGEVTVAAGEQAAVADDAEPEKKAVPQSVYLKVRWPEERMTRDTSASVRGHADPSSRVEVNGEPVTVARDGSFEAEVKLKDGRNRVTVHATDIHDRTTSVQESVLVRRRAPKVEAKSEGIWE